MDRNVQPMRAGELCAGYGGLALAVEDVFGAETVWFSEFEEAPSKILKHHWPEVPNHGDMTRIDWAAIEPVDIISGGTPCQDLSHAGRRKGMTAGTRSNLWVQMREAIAIQRPRYVVWENVRGAYSAEADSDLEQCPGCMGDAADRGTVLRALGRVLGDLSDLGFHAEWRGLRAADVGACHSRYRVFVLAVRRDALADAGRLGRDQAIKHDGRRTAAHYGASIPNQSDRLTDGIGPLRAAAALEDSDVTVSGQRRVAAPRQAESGRTWADASGRNRTPAADASSARAGLHVNAGGQARQHSRTRGAALVSPADGEGAAEGHLASSGEPPVEVDWGVYAPAIGRWESVMGRRAPAPTEPTGRDQGQRLSPRFTEWMMGLPDGWVTDPEIGISRNEQLKACGNGVVPQQAVAALKDMLRSIHAEL